MSDRHTAGLLGRLHAHDARFFDWLVGRRHRRLDRLMRAITRVGDAPVMVGLALVLLASGHAAVHLAGARAAIALATSHLLVQLVKRTVSRPRPHLPVGMAALIQPPDRFSFPSGHAAAALSVAAAIATVLSAPVALFALALGVLVGVSRCYLGVHYPGDVLAGWLLALSGVLFAVL